MFNIKAIDSCNEGLDYIGQGSFHYEYKEMDEKHNFVK